MYKDTWYCRWCGGTYEPTERTERDGFCTSKHKQAHYRAYGKYVTVTRSGRIPDHHQGVTLKKRKKRK